MIAEALDIQKETYLAIVLDRDHDGPGTIFSPM
jgi:succinyl-CoA synthetase beta subunit